MSGEGGGGGFPGGGGGGGFGGLGDLLQQASRIKERISEMQNELANKKVDGTSGGGMVTATVNGKGELLAIKLEKNIVDPSDIEMLQDLIVAAVNDAGRRSRDAAQEEMSKLTGGIKIPGIF